MSQRNSVSSSSGLDDFRDSPSPMQLSEFTEHVKLRTGYLIANFPWNIITKLVRRMWDIKNTLDHYRGM